MDAITSTGVARSDDPYAWHVDALAGKIESLDLGHVPCGFFRLRNRDGSYRPVAIWPDEAGVLWAKVGDQDPECLDGKEPEFSDRVFAHCWRSPITEQTYWSVHDGGPWPDAPPERAETFSNLPTDPLEAFQIEIAGEREEIERWLAGDPIQDQTACDRAANWAVRLADLEKKIGAGRVAEKRPHDEAAKAVQMRWKPIEDEAAALKRRLKDAQLPFQQRKARLEAEARAEAARRGEALRPAASTGAGTMGRKSSLRTQACAEIQDFDAALTALKDNPEIRDLVQRLADKVARAGGCLAGCRTVHVQSVA